MGFVDTGRSSRGVLTPVGSRSPARHTPDPTCSVERHPTCPSRRPPRRASRGTLRSSRCPGPRSDWRCLPGRSARAACRPSTPSPRSRRPPTARGYRPPVDRAQVAVVGTAVIHAYDHCVGPLTPVRQRDLTTGVGAENSHGHPGHQGHGELPCELPLLARHPPQHEQRDQQRGQRKHQDGEQEPCAPQYRRERHHGPQPGEPQRTAGAHQAEQQPPNPIGPPPHARTATPLRPNSGPRPGYVICHASTLTSTAQPADAREILARQTYASESSSAT